MGVGISSKTRLCQGWGVHSVLPWNTLPYRILLVSGKEFLWLATGVKMKTSLVLLAMLGFSAFCADVQIGSNQFPFNAPFCAN
jgi:hypothetical protein